MGHWKQVAIDAGIDIFFCDPHAPWQRATNENTNGLLRQYFPKGSDLSIHSAQDLDRVAAELNDRPRKRLDFKKPIEQIGPYCCADRQDPPYLKGALGVAALAAAGSTDTFFAACYRRLAASRCHELAIVVERAILTALWTHLTTSQLYHDFGADYYAKRRPGAIIAKALNQPRTAGINVTFTDPTVVT
jgi:hypothetical protein